MPYAVLDRVRQPTNKVLPELQFLRVEGEAAFPIRQGFGQLRRHLLTVLAVDGLPLVTFAVYTVYCEVGRKDARATPVATERDVEKEPAPRA
jgi:hypothetical protein